MLTNCDVVMGLRFGVESGPFEYPASCLAFTFSPDGLGRALMVAMDRGLVNLLS